MMGLRFYVSKIINKNTSLKLIAFMMVWGAAGLTRNSDASQIQPFAPIQLSLKECIKYALENNFDLKVFSLDPEISRHEIRKSLGIFDPIFFSDLSTNRNTLPNAFSLSGVTKSIEESRRLNSGLKKRFITGTDAQINLSVDRLETNSRVQLFSSQYTDSINFTINQNLLRKAGIEINKIPEILARNGYQISKLEFERKLMDLILEVQKTYWELVKSKKSLEVNKESLKLAEDLFRQIDVQVRVGTLPTIELIQAEAEVASRKEAIILAETQVKNLEDELKRLINIDDPIFWEREIIPSDEPSVTAFKATLDESIGIALQRRPEYLNSKIDAESKGLILKLSKNSRYPLLDLRGTFSLNGLSGKINPNLLTISIPPKSPFEGDLYDSFDTLSSGDYYTWQIGIYFEYPIGNRQADATYKQSMLEREKALINIKNTEQRIIMEVRQTVRDINANLERIEAAKKSRQLAEERLKAEEKKFAVGMSTSYNVFQMQRDLIAAKTEEIKAIIDYNISIYRW
ncbi:MAG: TolC family protein, partial [Candidatus Aenigmatarchaeota archaeon]